MWHSRYTLNTAMLPSFVEQSLASDILLVGKSINFIRACCGDTEWVLHHDDAAAASAALAAGGGDPGVDAPVSRDGKSLVSDLSAIAAAVAPQVNQRLLHLLFREFHILDHLRALKRYLLLGQGDFITSLMATVAPELDKPATRQMHHTLAACLEGALRSSNAQYEAKEIQDRLDVQCHATGDGDGEALFGGKGQVTLLSVVCGCAVVVVAQKTLGGTCFC